MTNIIKVLSNKSIALSMNGKTRILHKRISTLGLSSWYNIKNEIYA